MRFLVDNSLSPRLALALRDAAHDAVHLRDLMPANSPDVQVFERAAKEDRVLLAADTDFGTLLATREAMRPSVVLFRRRSRTTDSLLRVLTANLPTIEPDLISGAVIVIDDARIRIRRLPFR